MLYVPGIQLSDCTVKLLNRPLGNVFSEHIMQLWMVTQRLYTTTKQIGYLGTFLGQYGKMGR